MPQRVFCCQMFSFPQRQHCPLLWCEHNRPLLFKNIWFAFRPFFKGLCCSNTFGRYVCTWLSPPAATFQPLLKFQVLWVWACFGPECMGWRSSERDSLRGLLDFWADEQESESTQGDCLPGVGQHVWVSCEIKASRWGWTSWDGARFTVTGMAGFGSTLASDFGHKVQRRDRWILRTHEKKGGFHNEVSSSCSTDNHAQFPCCRQSGRALRLCGGQWTPTHWHLSGDFIATRCWLRFHRKQAQPWVPSKEVFKVFGMLL